MQALLEGLMARHHRRLHHGIITKQFLIGAVRDRNRKHAKIIYLLQKTQVLFVMVIDANTSLAISVWAPAKHSYFLIEKNKGLHKLHTSEKNTGSVRNG